MEHKEQKNKSGHADHTSHTNHAGHAIAGLAALAAAAAGFYFLYGSDDATKTRKKIKSWTLRLKAELMDKIETMKDVSEDTYYAAVTEIADKYAVMKDINKDELADLTKSLKSHWKDIKKDIEAAGASAKEKLAE
jgi:RecJ-like exonuclease